LSGGVGGDARGFCGVAARDAIEQRDQRAAEGIGRDAHDRGIARELRKKARAGRLRIDAVPDEQHDHKTKHAECLHAEAAYAAAAERDLDGFADGACLSRTVGGAHVGIGRAPHPENADGAGHTRAHQKGESARLFHKEAENNRDDQHDKRDHTKLGSEKRGRAAADYRGQIEHLFRTLRHFSDAEELTEHIDDREQDDTEYQQPGHVGTTSFSKHAGKSPGPERM